MPEKLSIEELYKCCDPGIFTFHTTDELPMFYGTIGQERALDALGFGLSLEITGFNIFLLGENGTGRITTIKSILMQKAVSEPVPPDWCYVYNFKDPDAPIAISLEPGEALVFQKDMEELIKTLKVEIPKVFDSKEYEKLDEKTRKKIDEIGKTLQEKLNDAVHVVREAEKLVKEKIARLEKEAALAAVGHLIDELKGKYQKHEKIITYLDGVKENILENLDDFKVQEEQAPALPFMKLPKTEPTFTRYTINVLVNNKDAKGAPCIFESNPTYFNLFGRIEHKFQYGIAITDFSMVKGGSLHKANGGYIVIDALDLLRNLFAYDALKRAIRNKEVKTEDVWEQYRLISTTTLKPEAIPLDVKVILVGNPNLYYLLYNLDEEYRELFKVKADFDSRMERTNENMYKYASFVAMRCKEEKLLPFDRTGVAKVVEVGSRLAEHQNKLTSRFSEIADVIREASYWASKSNERIVTEAHVQKAIDERVYRTNRMEERLREMILEGTLIVETEGEKVGQVNGLAVLDLGDYSFGKPSRITAKAYAGKAGVVNIERETKMSGKIHEKAILILKK